MSNTETMTEPTTFTLRIADRCDRCGAQAWVAVAVPGAESALLFCAHHFTEHEPAVLAKGYPVLADNREALKSEEIPGV